MPDKPTDDKLRKPAAPAAGDEPAAGQPPRGQSAAAADEHELDAAEKEALRRQWSDEAREKTEKHDKQIRTFLLRLSLANWGIAVVAWTISAALGITSPASIIVYSVLFVIGLVAAILAILTYLLEKFGHEPAPIGPIGGDEDGDAAAAAADTDTAAPAAG